MFLAVFRRCTARKTRVVVTEMFGLTCGVGAHISCYAHDTRLYHIPIEAYRGSPTAKQELFAIVRLMWQTEVIPPAFVRGTFVMLYKKGPRDNFGNYRAIGLMCHSYKRLSMLVLHRMQDAFESRLTCWFPSRTRLSR